MWSLGRVDDVLWSLLMYSGITVMPSHCCRIFGGCIMADTPLSFTSAWCMGAGSVELAQLS